MTWLTSESARDQPVPPLCWRACRETPRMAGGPTVGAARARIRPARNRTRGVSNEAKRNLGRHVSALDPLADASHYGRHRPWDIESRALKHCAAHPRGLPVRDARARRTAIGARHHAARRVVRGSHARHPHEGGTLQRDRQVHRRLFLRLDTLGARRARGLHLHPLGARTVESATGPAEVVDPPTVAILTSMARSESLADESRAPLDVFAGEPQGLPPVS